MGRGECVSLLQAVPKALPGQHHESLLLFPHAVQVAISSGCYITLKFRKTCFRWITGLEKDCRISVAGDDFNPFNIVIRRHRMIYGTDRDDNAFFRPGNDRDMLFSSRINVFSFLSSPQHTRAPSAPVRTSMTLPHRAHL